MGSLTLTSLSGIPLIKPGDNLANVILIALEKNGISLQNGDILVLAQKIVSKSENRFVNLNQVIPSSRARELAAETEKDPRFVELVLQESNCVLRVRPGTLIVEHRNGFICANAGIDHSNVSAPWGNQEDWVLLLPEDSDKSAKKIQSELQSIMGVDIGVLVIDSHGRAWRNGTIGMTIGLANMPGLVDLRGTPDLFGYSLRITQVGAADELAAAASLIMGQAAEGSPIVHARGFPYSLRSGSLSELIRPHEFDLFR